MKDFIAPKMLYSFRRCPYAMRARMALKRAGLNPEHREIVLRAKPAHMLQISPKGTVPVLQLMDGCVLEESLEIMAYACPGEYASADHGLIQKNDQDFKPLLDRYKYPSRFEGEDCSQAFENAVEILKIYDEQMGKSRDTLTDLAIFPFVRQFANVDEDRFRQLPLGNLHHWLEAHVTSPLFSSIMAKIKPWQEGDCVVYFDDIMTFS